MKWRIIHKSVTASTNADAHHGKPGDVFTADFQTAGRGRLDHVWKSCAGKNLMMSAVVDVSGLEPERVATFPLVVGLSVCEAAGWFLCEKDIRQSTTLKHPNFQTSKLPSLKWPNDVLVGGRKLAGILCERFGDSVIAGVGVNVGEREFPSDIADRATSLSLLLPAGAVPSVDEVRDAVLERLAANLPAWRERGLAAHLPRLAARDCLAGREIAVLRTDGDAEPARGACGGIAEDGSLIVSGERIYAGEAHVL